MTQLVEIRDLNIRFTGERIVHAVNNLSLSLGDGEVLGLLGESGSGKSVTLRALMRLLPNKRTQISGHIEVLGRDVLALQDEALSAFRGQTVSMIFQEPALALDPVYTIGHQIAETVMRHEGKSYREAMARALEMLDVVRIPSAKRRLDAYPHEMSGGMRQRAMIALALACKPKILLADEPTTALDATVQIQILLLLRELQRAFGMSVIFVTHDIGVARSSSRARSGTSCARQFILMRAGFWRPPCTAPNGARGWKPFRERRPRSTRCRPAVRSRPVALSRKGAASKRGHPMSGSGRTGS
jgi:peptide/nickel transport system ATP-binding protein